MPARCRSNCTVNKTPVVCNAADKCSYTNGAIRKYCRLSSKYKMNKPNCNITRKFLKREKGPAEKIRKFLERRQASRKRKPTSQTLQPFSAKNVFPEPPILVVKPSASEIKKFENKTHTRKLERFMRKLDPHKLRANVRARYLNAVCSDSGVCVAFGTHVNKIKKHFDGFVNFNHVTYLRKIGTVSENGFVKELEYEHAGYKAHAVLKSSTKPYADNLYYEYLVGIFINNASKYMPNFVETYGVYKYNTNDEYNKMRLLTATKSELSGLRLIRTPVVPKSHIKKEQQQTERNHLKDACEYSKHMCVLIQHIKDAQTLQDKCQSVSFVAKDLPFALFQVYWALVALKNDFTHYDLHTENVLIYEPVKNSHIQYFYHFTDGTVVAFKSSYIAKLIDYGRSFYNYGNPNPTPKFNIEHDSKSVYSTICKIPECNPRCGYNFGFGWFAPSKGICSQMSNVSQDLRLLALLHDRFNDIRAYNLQQSKTITNIKYQNPLLLKLCKKVKYENAFDTPQVTALGYPAAINNIFDAFMALKELVQNPFFVATNSTAHAGMRQLGEMHIYQDRPLEYIPTV